MKKQLTKIRLIGYLLMLTAVSLGVLSLSYARYADQVIGEATAKVAFWGSDTAIDQLPIDINGLAPGGKKEFSFLITNEKGGKVSQVAQDYTVSVETTGNLPLEFILTPTGTAPTDSKFVTTDGSDGKLNLSSGNTAVANGGFLPYITPVTHKYTLTVSWPDGAVDSDYAEEIDLVTLVISAKQVLPGAE